MEVMYPAFSNTEGTAEQTSREGKAQTLMNKDYYKYTGAEKTSRDKSLLWKIMLPVIGMTGFAVALALLGLYLTPDSNGSYMSLSLSDRTVKLVANKVEEAPADAAHQSGIDMAKEWAKGCIADIEAVEQIGQKYIDGFSERLRNEHGVTNQEDINDYISIMSLYYLHYIGELHAWA